MTSSRRLSATWYRPVASAMFAAIESAERISWYPKDFRA